jgi:hypothetical protein
MGTKMVGREVVLERGTGAGSVMREWMSWPACLLLRQSSPYVMTWPACLEAA